MQHRITPWLSRSQGGTAPSCGCHLDSENFRLFLDTLWHVFTTSLIFIFGRIAQQTPLKMQLRSLD